MSDTRAKLIDYGKKTIGIEGLAALLRIDYYNTKDLYETVNEMVVSGVIEPVKSSGKNGNVSYPLYKKYRILAAKDDDAGAAARVRLLHPKLQMSGYLARHPDILRTYEKEIMDLNSFMFFGQPGEYIARKERSLEIFGREKVLDDKSVRSLINSLGLTKDDLGFYDTPEYCFHDYIPVRRDDMTLLVCENKDIWFNIRRCMFEDGCRSIFGVPLDGVVYGNGNKVSDKKGALSEYVKFMGNPIVRFLYWGDIDRFGFDIFKRTLGVNEGMEICLFHQGYKLMIERAYELCEGDMARLEDSPSSKKEGVSFDDLFTGFSPQERDFLNGVLGANKLIPQEIISYSVLKEYTK